MAKSHTDVILEYIDCQVSHNKYSGLLPHNMPDVVRYAYLDIERDMAEKGTVVYDRTVYRLTYELVHTVNILLCFIRNGKYFFDLMAEEALEFIRGLETRNNVKNYIVYRCYLGMENLKARGVVVKYTQPKVKTMFKSKNIVFKIASDYTDDLSKLKITKKMTTDEVVMRLESIEQKPFGYK